MESGRAELKVFVGKLPTAAQLPPGGATGAQLQAVCERFGAVKDCKVMGGARPCGFVGFETEQACHDAIANLNGCDVFGVGVPLVCKFAERSKGAAKAAPQPVLAGYGAWGHAPQHALAGPYAPAPTQAHGSGLPAHQRKMVFLGGLPKSLSNADVEALFAQFGVALDVNVLRKPQAENACAFCEFQDPSSGTACIAAMNNSDYYGGKVTCRWAERGRQAGQPGQPGAARGGARGAQPYLQPPLPHPHAYGQPEFQRPVAAAPRRLPPAAPTPSPQVFLGKIPAHVPDEEVRELMAVYGEMDDFHVLRKPGAAQVCAFALFADPACGDACVAGLHQHELGGQALNCKYGERRGSRVPEHVKQSSAYSQPQLNGHAPKGVGTSKQVLVHGVPQCADLSAVQNCFQRYGTITGVLERDATGSGRTFAVYFATPAEAEAALATSGHGFYPGEAPLRVELE